MKDIAIIIVNFQMKEHVQKCLFSLSSLIARSKLNIEIVVVDNASGDDINVFLEKEYPAVHCIMLPLNQGFGKAQNAGIESVDAKYYFILNPDTIFTGTDDGLERLYTFMETHTHVGMAGPKLTNEDASLQYSCWRFPTAMQPLLSRTSLGKYGRGKKISDHYFMKDFDHNSTRPVDAIMGSAMFVRRQALQEVGKFDERFWMYFEDTDWCIRMWERQWAVYYLHDVVLTHVHGRGSAKVPGIISGFFKNKLARIHVMSWIVYMWKWRLARKFYTEKT